MGEGCMVLRLVALISNSNCGVDSAFYQCSSGRGRRGVREKVSSRVSTLRGT
jgi:hypothetical protein